MTPHRSMATLGLPVILMALLSRQALAAPQDEDGARKGLVPLKEYDGAPSDRPFLLGGWGGTRPSLAEQGVAFDLFLTQTYQRVVDGGLEEGGEYGGKLESVFTFDLDRMDAVPGALVSMRTESRYGESVNRSAGTLLAVNDVLFFPLTELDEDVAVAITELRYVQFLSTRFAFFLGKLTTLGGDVNEFAGGRGDTQFLGHPFLSASVTAVLNPYSALGAGALWMPDADRTVTTTLTGTQDASTTSGFDQLDEGLTWTTSVRDQYELGGRPGGTNVAFQYAFDGDFLVLDGQFVDQGQLNRPAEDSSWVAYANAWQYVSVEDGAATRVDVLNGRTDLRGVGLFARLGTGDPDTNPVRWVASGGVAGRGLGGRDDDTYGLGYSYGSLRENRFTAFPLIDTSGRRVEAYYSFALTPAVELTLDLQLADSLLETADPATIVGFRLRTAF